MYTSRCLMSIESFDIGYAEGCLESHAAALFFLLTALCSEHSGNRD